MFVSGSAIWQLMYYLSISLLHLMHWSSCYIASFKIESVKTDSWKIVGVRYVNVVYARTFFQPSILGNLFLRVFQFHKCFIPVLLASNFLYTIFAVMLEGQGNIVDYNTFFEGIKFGANYASQIANQIELHRVNKGTREWKPVGQLPQNMIEDVLRWAGKITCW